jgi:hypothetical protein
MTISIKGDRRERFRIRLFGRKISKPWSKKPFALSFEYPTDRAITKRLVDQVSVAVSRDEVRVNWNQTTLWHRKLALPAGELAFHVEPLKGVIVEGTIEVRP